MNSDKRLQTSKFYVLCDHAVRRPANQLSRAGHNTATATATATVTQNIMATDATAMADGSRPLSTTGLYLSVLLAVLHL